MSRFAHWYPEFRVPRVRGDRREPIVFEDGDRELFLDTFAEACGRTGWQVFAWVLMDNHYHAVFRTPEPNLVAGMAWIQNTTRSSAYPGRLIRNALDRKLRKECQRPAGVLLSGPSLASGGHRACPGGASHRRDLCGNQVQGAPDDRSRRAKDEAKQAVALACEHGLLKLAGESWESFREANQ